MKEAYLDNIDMKSHHTKIFWGKNSEIENGRD